MRLIFHRTFKKKYKKAPAYVQKKVDERLRVFAKGQFARVLNNHPLSGKRKGEWSINITGDWRAVYIREDTNITVFTDIDTHNNLYK